MEFLPFTENFSLLYKCLIHLSLPVRAVRQKSFHKSSVDRFSAAKRVSILREYGDRRVVKTNVRCLPWRNYWRATGIVQSALSARRGEKRGKLNIPLPGLDDTKV